MRERKIRTYVVACVDLHAFACNSARMDNLIHEIEAFMDATGLSEHRTGYLLAKNGRLIPRLRSGRRIWPETEALIRKKLVAEKAKRLSATEAGAA